MGLNGFTEWLFSALLSWMQIIYNWFWSMLSTGGQNEFMPWFSDNWLTIVGVLLIVGLVVDYTIYLMRWQPYHVWLTTLRRARGYVSRPFVKEQPRLKYAGYRRVLEGYEGSRDDRRNGRAAPDAHAPRTDSAPAQVYEAAQVYEPSQQSRSAATDAGLDRHAPHAARPALQYDAHITERSDMPDMSSRAYPDGQYAGDVHTGATSPADDAPFTAAATAPQDSPAYTAGMAQQPALDAEGYEPEHIVAPEVGAQLNALAQEPAPQVEEPMFGQPPQFVHSERETPMYGVYTGRGPQFMPIGMADDRPAHMEMPDMPVFEETIAPPPPAQPAPQQAPQPARPQQPTAPQATSQPAQPATQKPAPAKAPAPAAPRPARRTVEGYESRSSRRMARMAAQQAERPIEATQPAQQRPVQAAQPAQQRPVQAAQPAQQRPVQPAPRVINVQPDPRTTRPAPRTIAVHKAGITRDIEFDED